MALYRGADAVSSAEPSGYSREPVDLPDEPLQSAVDHYLHEWSRERWHSFLMRLKLSDLPDFHRRT